MTVLELFRRKDLPVVFILAAVILMPLALFTPFGVAGAGRAMHEVAILLVWLFSIAITLGVAARLFPSEIERRTIFPLLSKPATRGTILVGKFLGAWCAAGAALAIFYLAYALFAGGSSAAAIALLLQALLLHLALLGVICALALVGSLWLSLAANLTLCGLLVGVMLLFGQQLPQLAADQSQPFKGLLLLCHWLAPHVEFFDLRLRLVHEWPLLSWRVCGAVLLYAVGYSTILLGVANVLLKRKRWQ